MQNGINVYNLYPQLVGHISKWSEHLDRVSEMNFKWIYVNPFHLPGFSGSCYSLKSHYLYNPLFTKGSFDYENLENEKEKGDNLIKEFCYNASKKGLNVMMDIVINHTSFDSELIENHSYWYEHNSDGEIKKPGTLEDGHFIEWGDLLQIDNLSKDIETRREIWKYWRDYLTHYINLGIKGFRCDAAYMVPTELWKFLIYEIKKQNPEIIFLAETLNCKPEKIKELSDAGFDFVMNSIKWWNYKDHWFMMDYSKWMGTANSLAFPENHDTERFAKEYGTKDKAIATYAIQSYFSSSIAITTGFEYGFTKKIDVVTTNPLDWEEATYDITDEIKRINKTKSTYKILQEDSKVYIYDFHNNKVFGFIRESNDGEENILVIANLCETEGVEFYVPNLYNLLRSERVLDISHGHRMERVADEINYYLQPNEVKIFYAKKGE